MHTAEMKAGGIVVFWNAAEADRTKLLEGLKALSLEQYTPEPRTPYAVLKDALAEHFPSDHYLIRPTDDSNTFDVVRETRAKGAPNHYSHEHSVKVEVSEATPGTPVVETISCQPWSVQQHAVRESYRKLRPILHGSSVTTALVKIVLRLGGTALRPHGGIYWLNESHGDLWSKIARAFETSGTSSVYTMRLKYDADMVRAVSAAISAEIEAEASQIMDEVNSGDLGARACQTREKKSAILLEKLGAYESSLGITLDGLRENLSKAQAAAAMNALLATAPEAEAVA